MTTTTTILSTDAQDSTASCEHKLTVAFGSDFGARVQLKEDSAYSAESGEVILSVQDALDAARYIFQELGGAEGAGTAVATHTKYRTTSGNKPFPLKEALSNLVEHSRREAVARSVAEDSMPWLDEARDALAFADGLSVTHVKAPDGAVVERIYGWVDHRMEEHLRGVCDAYCPICCIESEERQRAAAPKLLAALLDALPYVEDVLSNPEHLACFKKGVVQAHVKAIRAAIADATGEGAA